MKTVKLSELFNIDTGKDLIYSELEPGKYLVVGQKAENNGIVGTTKKLDNYKLYKANSCITLAHIGNFYATIQPKDFYIGTRVKALIPKEKMTFNELMYYAMAINANKYRFSYGRVGANRIDDLLLPAEIPDWVYEIEEPDLSKYKEPFNNSSTPELNTDNWKEFKYTDIFDTIMIGKSIDLNKLDEGDINYVGRTEENNGITAKVAKYNNQEPYEGNCITVPMVGNALKSTYQEEPFYVAQNILILRSKNLNKYNAMFFNTIIRMDEFRFCYGRTLSLDRFKALTIKLPTTEDGQPDYQFMEDYIKTLPYSKYI